MSEKVEEFKGVLTLIKSGLDAASNVSHHAFLERRPVLIVSQAHAEIKLVVGALDALMEVCQSIDVWDVSAHDCVRLVTINAQAGIQQQRSSTISGNFLRSHDMSKRSKNEEKPRERSAR